MARSRCTAASRRRSARPRVTVDDPRWPRSVQETPLSRAVRRGVPLDDHRVVVEVAGAFATRRSGHRSADPGHERGARERPGVRALARELGRAGAVSTARRHAGRDFRSWGLLAEDRARLLGPGQLLRREPGHVAVRRRLRRAGDRSPGRVRPPTRRFVARARAPRRPRGGGRRHDGSSRRQSRAGSPPPTAARSVSSAAKRAASTTPSPGRSPRSRRTRAPHEAALFSPRGQLVTDDVALAEDGRFVGYVGTSAMTLGRDGSIEHSPQRFAALVSSGALALAQDAEHRLWQSTDFGRHWLEVGRPPGSTPGSNRTRSRGARASAASCPDGSASGIAIPNLEPPQ